MTNAMATYCGSCGTEFEPAYAFCGSCGERRELVDQSTFVLTPAGPPTAVASLYAVPMATGTTIIGPPTHRPPSPAVVARRPAPPAPTPEPVAPPAVSLPPAPRRTAATTSGKRVKNGRVHKQFRTHLLGETTLTGPELISLARRLAESTRAGGLKLKDGGVGKNGSRLHVEMRSTGLNYALVGLNAVGEQGGFVMELFAADSGRTEVHVHLNGAYSSQWTVNFVPVVPKSVVGFEVYSKFLKSLQASIRRSDPTASVAISNQPI